MKFHCRLGALAPVLISLCASASAGLLEPPAAPAPTVNPAEPRMAITTLPRVIDTAGSYYLIGDLTGVAGQGGVTVAVDDVTLDLMGFALRGVPTSANGITVAGGVSNIVIRNGTIGEWGGDGVNSLAGEGVVLEDLALRMNAGGGLKGGLRHSVRRCRFEGNGDGGAFAGGGSVIEECSASGNEGTGLEIDGDSMIRNSQASGTQGTNIRAGDGGQVIACTASQGSAGISVQSDCTVVDCEVFSPVGGNGIAFRENCVIARNLVDDISIEVGPTPGALRTGFGGSVIEDNTVTNSIVGLYIEGENNIIRGNTVRGNTSNYLIPPANQTEILLSEIPETINFPATVRVTGDLFASGEGGIGVCSRDVTIDLGGHTLHGAGATGAGIYLLADTAGPFPIENTVICNGTLRDWDGGGIVMEFLDGVHVENVTVQDCGAQGILVGNEARVIACTARGNADDGIRTGEAAVVVDCIAEGNLANGIAVGNSSTVERCTGRLNVDAGILGGEGVTVRDSAGESNRFENLLMLGGAMPKGTSNNGHGIRCGDGAVIVNCTAQLNDVDGIRATDLSSVIGCSARLNDGSGFRVTGTLSGCSAAENGSHGYSLSSSSSAADCGASHNGGIGFRVVAGDVTLTGCESRFNGDAGFDIGSDSHIAGCTALTNTGDGIAAGSDSRVVGNHCQGNGNGAGVGAGIRVIGTDAHIEGNTANENDEGIVAASAGTLIVKNTAAGNGMGNYNLAATTNHGPIVSLTNAGAFTGADPWANFER